MNDLMKTNTLGLALIFSMAWPLWLANIFVPQTNNPAFWLVQIGEMEYRHRSISDLRSIPGIYQTFTAEQVHEAMKKCVADNRLIRFEAIPDAAPAAIPPNAVN